VSSEATVTQTMRALDSRIGLIAIRTANEQAICDSLLAALVGGEGSGGLGHRIYEYRDASGMRYSAIDEKAKILSPKAWSEWDDACKGDPNSALYTFRALPEETGKELPCFCPTHRMLWVPAQSARPCPSSCKEPALPSHRTFIMRGISGYLAENPNLFRNLFEACVYNQATANNLILLLEPGVDLPEELLRIGILIDDKLPTRAEITLTWGAFAKSILNSPLHWRKGILTGINPADPKVVTSVVDRLAGLSSPEIVNALKMASSKVQDAPSRPPFEVFLEVLAHAKEESLRKSAALESLKPVKAWEMGGLDLLKDWLQLRASTLTPAARDAGIPPPRGVLLLGIPGGGKSLCAKVCGDILGLPTYALDFGSVFGKYVGDSEANIRNALATIEAAAPCVLLIEELEKALGGESSDGGTSTRVLGKFLTWMNDRPADLAVFVVASANNIKGLPPEVLRKGRFSEIFFVDLPSTPERQDILRIHLKKARLAGGDKAHTLTDDDVRIAAEKSNGYTGAELAEAVIAARIAAFAEGVPVELRHVLKEIGDTKPLSKTMAEPINAMRSWARDRARMASTPVTPQAAIVTERPSTDAFFGQSLTFHPVDSSKAN